MVSPESRAEELHQMATGILPKIRELGVSKWAASFAKICIPLETSMEAPTRTAVLTFSEGNLGPIWKSSMKAATRMTILT